MSYNGGNGGITARPTSDEQTAAQGRHIPPVAAQTEHVQAARSNPQLRASANHGKPPIAATSKPGALSQPGVVAATEAGAIHESPALAANNGPRANTAVHPERPSACRAPGRSKHGESEAGPAIPATAGKASWRNRTRNESSCSRSRSRTTSGWRNRRLMLRRRSGWSNSTATDAAVGAKTRPADAGVESEPATTAQGQAVATKDKP